MMPNTENKQHTTGNVFWIQTHAESLNSMLDTNFMVNKRVSRAYNTLIDGKLSLPQFFLQVYRCFDLFLCRNCKRHLPWSFWSSFTFILSSGWCSLLCSWSLSAIASDSHEYNLLRQILLWRCIFQILMFPLFLSLECLYCMMSSLIIWLTVTHLIHLSKESLNFVYL